jgi:hypothetical protein
MLVDNDVDQQILSAINRQLYGPNDEEECDHLASSFMSQRLCDLEQHEKYFCYMQNLLITSGNVDKPKFLKYYLHSFPVHVHDVVE